MLMSNFNCLHGTDPCVGVHGNERELEILKLAVFTGHSQDYGYFGKSGAGVNTRKVKTNIIEYETDYLSLSKI